MAYGPPHIRQHKLALIDAEFMKVPGARRIDPATLPPTEYFWVRDRVAAGIPDIFELRWLDWVPNGSHIAFSPVSPIRGTDAQKRECPFPSHIVISVFRTNMKLSCSGGEKKT